MAQPYGQSQPNLSIKSYIMDKNKFNKICPGTLLLSVSMKRSKNLLVFAPEVDGEIFSSQ